MGAARPMGKRTERTLQTIRSCKSKRGPREASSSCMLDAGTAHQGDGRNCCTHAFFILHKQAGNRGNCGLHRFWSTTCPRPNKNWGADSLAHVRCDASDDSVPAHRSTARTTNTYPKAS